MLEEFQKIIDLESFSIFIKDNIQEPLEENSDIASTLECVGKLKVFDFLRLLSNLNTIYKAYGMSKNLIKLKRNWKDV